MNLRSSRSDAAMIGHVREMGTWTGEGIFDNDISVNVVTRHPSSVTLAAAVRKEKKGKKGKCQEGTDAPLAQAATEPSRTLTPVRSLIWPLSKRRKGKKKEASGGACREGSRG